MVSGVESVGLMDITQELRPAEIHGSTGFSQQLLSEISSVNDKLLASESALQDLATGKSTNIHHVMLALEDARLSFQLLTQVRNKLLESYQDIIRMQV